ncbi:hypothetical protein BJ508DRAFT_75955 [Ascobolus immersus RN42]|uniref:Uncharacterized protein n=1 Tax=Ascobolus immersus RN42 TaxID=1160509 RepID=A0A3N4HDI8_ASCIM|nr:hypothetical protein BJ508DRAFT_75955 [Ascobolus immersus RN42]
MHRRRPDVIMMLDSQGQSIKLNEGISVLRVQTEDATQFARSSTNERSYLSKARAPISTPPSGYRSLSISLLFRTYGAGELYPQAPRQPGVVRPTKDALRPAPAINTILCWIMGDRYKPPAYVRVPMSKHGLRLHQHGTAPTIKHVYTMTASSTGYERFHYGAVGCWRFQTQILALLQAWRRKLAC